MLERTKTYARKKRLRYMMPPAILLIALVLIFSGKVFSFGNQDRFIYLTPDSKDKWKLDEPFAKEWYANQEKVSFVVDLQEDFAEWQATHSDTPLPEERPFTIGAQFGKQKLDPQGIVITKINDPEFTGRYLVEVPFQQEGKLDLTVTIPDENAWGISESKSKFHITNDRTAPVIQLSKAENKGDVTLTVTVAEKHFSKEKVNVMVKEVDSPEPVRIQPEWQQMKDGSWRGTYVFSNSGEYDVTVNAVDLAGNAAAEQTISFALNKKSPQLFVTDTDNNTAIVHTGFSRSKNVQFKVVNGIRIKTAKVLIVQDVGDDEPVTGILDINKKEAVLDYSFPADGKYSVEAIVTENSGREYKLAPFELEVDSTAPNVDVTDGEGKPLQKEYSSNQEVKIQITDNYLNREKTAISGTRTELDGKKESLNDALTIDDSGSASYKAEKDGSYQLEITAQDLAGNETVRNIEFIIDREAPKVSTNFDKQHYKVKDFRLAIEDFTLNHELTKLEVTKIDNGAKEDYTEKIAAPDTEPWRAVWSHTFSEEGDYRVKLTSADRLAAPNPKTEEFQFTIDTTAPTITVSNLVHKEFYRDDVKGVEISVVDHSLDPGQIALTMTKDDEVYEVDPLVVNGETAANQYDFTDDGNYRIELEATDRAGNTVKINPIEFTIDKYGPDLSISKITDGGHYQELTGVEVKAIDLTLTETNLEIKRNGKTISSGPLKKSIWRGWWQAVKVVDFAEEGKYELILTASDFVGNQSVKTVAFTIDQQSPVIEFSGIGKDAFVQKGTLTINVKEANFAENTVKITAVRKVDRKGEAVPYEEIGPWENTGENSSLEHLLDKDGDYDVIVEAVDKAGNTAKESWQFTIDSVKPVIAISNRDEQNRFYSGSKEVTISVQERNFEGNQVTITATKKVEANGDKEAISLGEWKNDGELSSLSYVFSDDAEYELTVRAVDAAGNVGDMQSVMFTVDKKAPELGIAGVDNGEHYNHNRTVDFTLTDRNIDLAGTVLTVTKDDAPYLAVGQLEQSGTTAKRSFTFTEEGTYAAQLSAKDLAGNETVLPKVTFVIDKTKPVLNIGGVDDQSYNPTAKRNVTVSVDERYFSTNHVEVAATKDGRKLNIGEWKNTGKISTLSHDFVEDGLYTISVRAIDQAGNGPVSAAKTFTIDKVKPAIEITGVENGQHYNVDKQVTATIKDVNLDVNKITVTRNGAKYNAGSFTVTNRPYENSIAALTHTFSAEGEYVVLVEAVDKAGNSFSRQMTFTIDKTKPVITPKMKGENRTIVDGEYINKVFTPVFVLDKAEDEIVSVTLNGGDNLKNNIPAASREMAYNYKVVARDKAGNEAELSISFTIDTTKPFLKISGIVDGFFNNDITPVVEYWDKYLDASRTAVTLNDKPFVDGTKLEIEQDYVLQAKITDLANNVSSKSVVFTIDKTKPVIRFLEPISGRYFREDLIPQLLIEDMSAYDIISLTLDGEPYELGDPIKTEGKHVLFFEVKDKAGNIQQLSVEFIIDKTAPKVVYEGVKKSGTYYEPVTVKLRLDNPEDVIKSVTVNGQLFKGDAVVENGYNVIKATFSEVKGYNIEVTAYDEAGNEMVETIPFVIAEKGLLTKFYENKPLFAGSMAGVAGLAAAGAALVLAAARKRRKVDE